MVELVGEGLLLPGPTQCSFYVIAIFTCRANNFVENKTNLAKNLREKNWVPQSPSNPLFASLLNYWPPDLFFQGAMVTVGTPPLPTR